MKIHVTRKTLFKSILSVLFATFASIFASTSAFGGICQNWSETSQTGTLEHGIINEASGLAVSKSFDDTLFHINDSGDGPYIYKTKMNGDDTESVIINGFSPNDVEDLAIGSCHNGKSCLIVGDIGDNERSRETVSLVLIDEQATLNPRLEPLALLELRYPDHPHDAEGMAMHPNGDLYILTKEADYRNGYAKPAQLFRLSKNQLNSPAPGIKDLEWVGEFDLPTVLGGDSIWGQIVTGFDISPDGKNLLILTYESAIEVRMDLSEEIRSSDTWIENTDFKKIMTAELPQQEAITYLNDGLGFIYNTEYKEYFGSAPIYQTMCQE